MTPTEKRMLVRLERSGLIYWRAIKAPETRTLRRLVAKGLAVEGTADRGLLAWRVAGPSNDPRAEARVFAHGALAELSAEILAWRRIGVLNGDRLRELARILTGLSPSDDALQQAERLVETLALELAASRMCEDLDSAVRNGANDAQLGQLVRTKLTERGHGDSA